MKKADWHYGSTNRKEKSSRVTHRLPEPAGVGELAGVDNDTTEDPGNSKEGRQVIMSQLNLIDLAPQWEEGWTDKGGGNQNKGGGWQYHTKSLMIGGR